MTLKELTSEKHGLAENTLFMKSVFDKTLPKKLWMDYTYQKYIWYREIELAASAHGLLDNLPGLARSQLIMNDYQEMAKQDPLTVIEYKKSSIDYASYIRTLNDPKRILAHLYTWHMGDLFGGQMIKKIVNAPHSSLEFSNAPEIMKHLRALLSNDLAEEANKAFDWAIQILQEYNHDLASN